MSRDRGLPLDLLSDQRSQRLAEDYGPRRAVCEGRNVDEQRCGMCGSPVDAHDRQVRFRLPEPVLDSPGQERVPGAWLSHENPEASVMMQIPGVGPFVRALLVVRLTGGYAVTYGVWAGVHPDDLQRAFRVWWEPEYENLRLEGALANSVPPWGLLAAPVTLAVKDPEHTPYCVSSSDHMLSRVLGQEWPHKDVLETLP